MHSFKSIPHNSMPRTIPLPESENPYHPNTQNTMNRLRVQRRRENTKINVTIVGGKVTLYIKMITASMTFFKDRAP